MKKLPKLTADGANIISGEHVDHVMIAAAITHDQAQQIVRAVNTFDQAREALKDLVNSFEMDYMLDGVIVDRPRPEFVRLYRIQKAALAAMEECATCG